MASIEETMKEGFDGLKELKTQVNSLHSLVERHFNQ